MLHTHILTNEKEAKEIIELKGRIGQTINIYVLASQQSKELTGHYFDEDSRTRILSSRRGIVLVEVSFDENGQFSIFWPLKSSTSADNLGVRSVLIE